MSPFLAWGDFQARSRFVTLGTRGFFSLATGSFVSSAAAKKLGLIRVIKEKVVISACKENHFYRSQHLRPPFAFTSSTKRENKHFHVVVMQ